MGLFDYPDEQDPNATQPPPAPSIGPGGGFVVGPGSSPGTVQAPPGGVPIGKFIPGPGGVGPPAFTYTPPPFTGPPNPNFKYPPVPVFTPLPFNAPDPASIANDPSYKFRLGQGEEALQASAAAKGMLRTGGTLKDFINYGQSAASQEYGNQFQRAIDVYNLQEGAHRDAYAPQLAAWQTMAGGAIQGGLAGFNQNFNLYNTQLTDERLREQMILDAWARAIAGTQQ